MTETGSAYEYISGVTGGIASGSNSTIKMTTNTFNNNKAYRGGIFYLENSATLDVVSSTFKSNGAYNLAGIIMAVTDSSFTFNNTAIS